MKHLKLYKSVEEFKSDKDNLIKPYVISIHDYQLSSGENIPVKVII